MDLATITMDRHHARQAFLEYRRAVRERHSDEDAEIMRGYRALAKGQQLIRLSETLKAGGTVVREYTSWNGREVVSVRLPALAIMRADQRECWLQISGGAEPTIRLSHVRWPHHNATRNVLTFRSLGLGVSGVESDWRAMVPIVPPGLRPKHSLSGYHILWEADWEKVKPPRPPGDPALLKHIGGDLYAVCAVWDLTPIEQAVLSRRYV